MFNDNWPADGIKYSFWSIGWPASSFVKQFKFVGFMYAVIYVAKCKSCKTVNFLL